MSIVLRSKVFNRTRGDTSEKKFKIHWSDWSSIREYNSYDDVRDIIWTRSTGQNLYVKEREGTGSIHIKCVFIGSDGDDFYIQDSSESKSYYLKKTENILKKSILELKIAYELLKWVDLDAICGSFLKKNEKSNLILIFHSYNGNVWDYKKLNLLAKHNDIVYIDVCHPFEKEPSSDILFDGKSLWKSDRDRYKKDFSWTESNKKKYLEKSGMAYMLVDTSEDIESRLNYFFKNRIQYG